MGQFNNMATRRNNFDDVAGRPLLHDVLFTTVREALRLLENDHDPED
jgi:hypothetical protein